MEVKLLFAIFNVNAVVNADRSYSSSTNQATILPDIQPKSLKNIKTL